MLKSAAPLTPAEQALQALSEPNFLKFILCLDKITDKSQQHNLIERAIQIAIAQKAVATLITLADKTVMLCDEAYYRYNNPLHIIINALIDFSTTEADATAISIATLYAQENNESKNNASLWLILCRALMEKQKADKVKRLYRFLKSDSEKFEMAKAILALINPQDNDVHWFEWFAHYLQNPQSYNDYFYSQGSLIDIAINHLSNQPDLNEKLLQLISPFSNRSGEDFIRQLFFKFLSENQLEKASLLLIKVPESPSWLKNIYQAFFDEKFFNAFEHEEFHYLSSDENENIFNIVLSNFFIRQEKNTVQMIVNAFLEAIDRAPSIKDMFLEKFSEICCRYQRADIALCLIKNHIPLGSDLFKTIAMHICNIPMTNEDYQFIVQQLNAWPKDMNILVQLQQKESEGKPYRFDHLDSASKTLIILLKIPLTIVTTEDKRRIKLEANQQTKEIQELRMLHDNMVSKKHKSYNKLIMQIEYYLTHEQLDSAFFFIKKIVASGYKDDYIKQIALLFIDNNRMQDAQKACDLLAHENLRWKQFPKKISTNKHQETLEWLLGEDDFYNIKNLVKRYINKIFIQVGNVTALDILFNSDIFSKNRLNLEDYYHSYPTPKYDTLITDNDSDILSVASGSDDKNENQSIEELIITRFIAHYADNENLINKISELKERGITGFEVAILDYQLRHHKWSRAIMLINLFITQNNGENIHYNLRYTEHLKLFEKLILAYFKAKPIGPSILNQAKQIASTDLYTHVLFELIIKRKFIPQIIEEITQITSTKHRYPLFDEVFMLFKQPLTRETLMLIHSILMHHVPDKEIKKHFFIKYILMTILNEPSLSDEKINAYWMNQEPFWYGIITQNKTLDLLEYMFKSSNEWDKLIYGTLNNQLVSFFNWIIDKCAQDIQMLITALEKIYTKRKDIANGNFSYTCFLEILYLSCLKWLEKKINIEDQWMLHLFTHFDQVFPENDAGSSTEFVATYEMRKIIAFLLKNNLQSSNEASIFKAFMFIFARTKKYTHDEYIVTLCDTLITLMHQQKIDFAYKLALIAMPQKYMIFSHRSKEQDFLGQLCSFWQTDADIHRGVTFLNQLEDAVDAADTYGKAFFKEKKLVIITQVVENHLHRGSLTQAHLFYHKYLNQLLLYRLKDLVKTLINKNYLLFAKEIIENNPGEPQQILDYRRQLVTSHFMRLSSWIGNEYADKIKEFYSHFIIVLQDNDKTMQNNLAMNIKNLLDKAFAAYYKQTMGTEPPKNYSKQCNFPAPVNESFKGKNPQEKLDQFLKEFKLKIDPNFYQYLIQIQPATNPGYTWLSQLRKLRNNEVHASAYLPATPTIDGSTIDMAIFLPKAIAGTEKILIKLFQHSISNDALDKYSLDILLSLDVKSVHIAAYALGLEQQKIAVTQTSNVRFT